MSDVLEKDAPPVDPADAEYEKAFAEFAAKRAGTEPEPEDAADEAEEAEQEDEAPAEETDSEGGEAKAEPAPAPDPLEALRALGLDPGRAAHEIKSNRERTSALQRKINELQSALNHRQTASPQQKAPSDEAPDGISDKVWARLRDELPEVANAVEAKFASFERQIQDALGQVREPIQRFEQLEHTRYVDSQYAALEAAHPGWRSTVNTEEFRSWLSAQPMQVQQIAASDDAEEASWMLDRFKRDLGATAEPARPDDAKSSEIAGLKQQRERRLKDSAGIVSRSGQGGQSGPPEDYEAAFEYFSRKRQRG